MNRINHWKNLSEAASARMRRVDSRGEMPFGFDTRVLARLRAVRELPAETWLRIALRAIPIGAAVLALCWFSIRSAPVPLPEDAARLAELVVEDALPR